MSSSYAVLCLSHDPAVIAADSEWNRPEQAEQAIRDGIASHEHCDLLIGRYSYLDLNDKGINGGIINEGTIGLNWFLNANSKIQFNYDLAYRDATRYNANGSVPTGGLTARDGLIQGFGTRLAFDF